MTRDELYDILDYRGIGPTSKTEIMELVWGQPFDGKTEKIKPATEESLAERRLELAHNAIRVATEQFDRVKWGWEGDCGSKNIMRVLQEFLPRIQLKMDGSQDGVTEKIKPATEESSAAGTTYTRSYYLFLNQCYSDPFFPDPTQPTL